MGKNIIKLLGSNRSNLKGNELYESNHIKYKKRINKFI